MVTTASTTHLDHAIASLKDAGIRVARARQAVGTHLVGGYAVRLEHALAGQHLHLVRAERDLEEVATGRRRATPWRALLSAERWKG